METVAFRCPFCNSYDCLHFIGHTEDGRLVELRERIRDHRLPAVLETDKLVRIGRAARVYRPF